ncbi:hypothetical protein ACPOL_1796 [Acidisarcina polymorpha]|uniref:Uncharacterized protein n=1 Tax=Acidisarcina polymorpha TaxID=2211140 RepID=A0A2Z5FWA4_9BACT|nr:hypothetical protein ACPOL_1796 [Acidisarcina polymorpha]
MPRSLLFFSTKPVASMAAYPTRYAFHSSECEANLKVPKQIALLEPVTWSCGGLILLRPKHLQYGIIAS